MNHASNGETEVQFKPELGKAVIEGKTTVPFQSLVTLILQRKVLTLFKQWGKEPVIIGSELLTGLASAPQDSQENRSHLVHVSLGVGVLLGVALFSLVLVALQLAQITLGQRELLMIAGG